jgi:hypothetical protein
MDEWDLLAYRMRSVAVVFPTDVFRHFLLGRLDRREKFFTYQTLVSPPPMRERASEG